MNKLFTTFLLLTSFMGQSFAQTTSTTTLNQGSLVRWRENLKVRYFGELVGPNLNKWDDNQYDSEGNKTSTPVNLYNQFNLQYKLVSATSLIVSPRFFYQIGDRNELKANEDNNSVITDDWLFGLNQEFLRNKSLIFNGRLTHRHPFSTYSQNSQLDSQIEYQNDLTWFVSPGITVLQWNTYRYYVYEAEKNEDRYRINFTTILNYDVNDKWRLQLFHELDFQHRAPKYGNKDVNKQNWNYFEKNKNHLALAFGYTPVPSFTVMPFVKALNDEDWSAETTQLGVWLFGKVF